MTISPIIILQVRYFFEGSKISNRTRWLLNSLLISLFFRYMTRLKVLFVSIVLFALLGMLLHEAYERRELERSIMYLCDGFAYSPLSEVPDVCK